MPGFAHLTAWSCHTHHQSVLTPQSLVATAAQAGQTAVGLCDRATLAGIPAFNTACHEHGVKPVIGEAFWLVDGSVDRSDPVMVKTEHRTDDMGKDMAGFFPRPGWLVNLIATNSHGWASLVQLHNHSWMCAKDGVPLVDVAMLAAHRDGLICLTGGMTGPLSHPLLFGRDQVAAQNLEALVGVYGANRVFVEVQNHGVAEERTVLGRLFNVAREQHVSLVVTNDNRYATPVERAVLDVVRAARVRKKHTDVAVFRQPGDGWHVRTETELRGVFPNSPVWQDAMDRAVWITDRISDTVLPAPESHTPNVGGAEWIRTQLIERLTTVYQGKPWVRQAVRQARAELDVMIKTGFTDYVAITAQLVEWAKTQGIRVGPGRGSSVASVICHVLGVTEVDPLEHGLLFERFLDPSDPDPSDIDLDVQQTRIPEVVGRLRDMLGTDHVARLSRPDTATGKPFDLDLINTIGDDDPELTCLVRDVWEGQTTGVDSHASGYVLSDEPLDQTVSMRVDGKSGEWLTEWDGPTMEAMGYPKLDVLSSVELEVDEQVSRATGGHTTMDAGYAQLATGRLAGVFQLGAESASRIAREIQPRSVGEVAACVALIRPGPRQAFQDTAYIDRCHDPELNVCPWTTDETEIRLLEPVVGSTRWMIIFQEQVMRLAGVMAGFDASERAGLRHALSGKDQARVDWFGGEFKRRAQQVQTGQDGTILSPAFHTTTVESVCSPWPMQGLTCFPRLMRPRMP